MDRKTLMAAILLIGAASPSAVPAAPIFNDLNFGETTFTAPETGLYYILTDGARGGEGGMFLSGGGAGGAGAEIGGDFNLTAGEVLTIVVGGKGNGSDYNGGGGGGGSFVFDPLGDVLIVAGGGGGGGSDAAAAAGNTDGGPGLTSRIGGAGRSGADSYLGGASGAGPLGLGGYGGDTGFTSTGGAGGGGVLKNGVDSEGGAQGGRAEGGPGGDCQCVFTGQPFSYDGLADGGFGGGGQGSVNGGGGGGGFSGGGGGGGTQGYSILAHTCDGPCPPFIPPNPLGYGGGGGGSYDGGLDDADFLEIIGGANTRTGNGLVEITDLTPVDVPPDDGGTTANGPTDVPEPTTLALFGAGFLGATVIRRRKVKSSDHPKIGACP